MMSDRPARPRPLYTAHLCLIFRLEDDMPVVIGADIYSSGPMSLTQHGGQRFAELCYAKGASYAKARETLLDLLELPMLSWVKPLM